MIMAGYYSLTFLLTLEIPYVMLPFVGLVGEVVAEERRGRMCWVPK